MLPSTSSFTAILVGGKLELADGSLLDSRAQLENDWQGDLARIAMTNSRHWWDVVDSLVEAMLRHDDELALAHVVSRRTIPRPDDPSGGDVRLATILRGGVGTVSGDGASQESEGTRWRLCEREDLSDSKRKRSRLVVYANDDIFLSGSDENVFARLERITAPGDVLILPHTAYCEEFLTAYSSFVNLGRDPGTDRFSETADTVAAEEAALLARPVPVGGSVSVTGLFVENAFRSPAPLESARLFVSDRYDLSIGFWDLVNEPDLRQTLLDEQPIQQTSSAATPRPASVVERAEKAIAAKEQREHEAAEERERQVKEAARELAPMGWRREGNNPNQRNRFLLPLTGSADPDGRGRPGPLLFIEVFVNKKSAAVYLRSHPGLRSDELAILDPYVDELNAAYGPDDHCDGSALCRIRKLTSVADVADRLLALQPTFLTVLQPSIEAATSRLAEIDSIASLVSSRFPDSSASVQAFRFAVAEPGLADALLVNLRDPDSQVRDAACRTMSKMELAEAGPLLWSLVRNDPSERVRRTAATSLAWPVENMMDIADLVRSEFVDVEDELKPAVLDALERHSPQDSMDIFLGAVESQNARVAETAVRSLSSVKDPRALDRVVELLNHEDDNVVSAALHSLQQRVWQHDETVATSLVTPYASSPSKDVREAALRLIEEVTSHAKRSSERAERADSSSGLRLKLVVDTDSIGEAQRNLQENFDQVTSGLLASARELAAEFKNAMAQLSGIEINSVKDAQQSMPRLAETRNKLAEIATAAVSNETLALTEAEKFPTNAQSVFSDIAGTFKKLAVRAEQQVSSLDGTILKCNEVVLASRPSARRGLFGRRRKR